MLASARHTIQLACWLWTCTSKQKKRYTVLEISTTTT